MRTIDTQAYLDTVCDLLAQGKTSVPVPVSGTSMCPFLHPGDTVYLDRFQGEAEVGDILLFRRPNGVYILHRVVGFRKDGRLLFLGDSQLAKEPIPPAWVKAKAVQARRKGETVTPDHKVWQFYRRAWVQLIPIRKPIMRLHRLIKTGK